MTKKTIETMVSELDIFTPPCVQTSVLGGDWQNYLPVQSISKDGPITFLVPGQGANYLDLSKTLLYVRFKIKNATNGGDITENDKVTVVNNTLNSLFGDVKLELNQTCVSNSNHMNHYRAYLETLFNFNETAKNSHLTSSLFYQDVAGGFDALDSKANLLRKEFVDLSKEVELCGRLHCDMLSTNKYLLNDIDLRMTLTRNPANLVVMSAATFTPEIEILEATLYIRKVTINPGILLAHAKVLETSTAMYPYKRVELLNHTIANGVHQKVIDNLFLNRMPTRVIFGLVKNSAFSGNVQENPFNFEHFDTNYVSLTVNGRTLGSAPYKLNYKENKYILPYIFGFYGCGIPLNDDGYCVGRKDYPNGFCLYSYDLSPDLSSSESHWSIQNQGSCRLELGFAKALPSVVNLVIFAEFVDCIEVDRNRNIHIQYKN
jgi:hypothetical protein